MNIIIDFIVFLGQCIFSTIPGIFANMAPIIFKRLNFLNYPLDFGLTINGDPLLGSSKTIRGFIVGTSSSIILMTLEYIVFKYTPYKNLGLIDFNQVNFFAIGFLMGFGVMMGDITESFIKRRLKIPSGKSLIPWDQIDCVLGGLLFGRIVWDFPISYGVSIIIITFLLHILIRHIAYFFGVSSTRW